MYVGEASLIAKYPFSRTRRFEMSAGYRTINYDNDIDRVIAVGDQVVGRETLDVPAPSGVNFVQSSAALVGDYSFFGFTSPVQGGRYRFEVAPTFGALRFHTVTADYRRYFFARPVTIALRGLHYGR